MIKSLDYLIQSRLGLCSYCMSPYSQPLIPEFEPRALEFNLDFFFSYDRALASQRCPQTHCVAEDDLEYLILLSLFPECWDRRLVPLCVVLCDAGESAQKFV